jgi:hypothetical protein
VAAADGLIWSALTTAGHRLLNSPAHKAQARDLPAAEVHTALPVPRRDIERLGLMRTAWHRLPEVADRYQVDPALLRRVLEDYARGLIAAGLPHVYEQTTTVLRPLIGTGGGRG